MIQKYLIKGETERVNEIVEKLQTVSKNGKETIQSFLSIGKVDSLLNNSSKENINIGLSINETLSNHNLTDKVKIIVENKQDIHLSMHSKAFESIFLNLVTNSIKYSNRFPQVIIQLYAEKNGVKVLFKDNGIGINLQKYRSKVFEPFVRINEDKNTEGSGVGLFLVKKIVNSYNGTIDIESEVGKGTTFILFFEN